MRSVTLGFACYRLIGVLGNLSCASAQLAVALGRRQHRADVAFAARRSKALLAVLAISRPLLCAPHDRQGI
jgi:hypothetical protein